MTACCTLAEHHAYYTDHDTECPNLPTVDGVWVTCTGEPLARGWLKEGYAAGSTDEGKWLCVWGSAYRGEVVFATAEAAEVRAEWLRSRAHESTRDSVVVRRVRGSGSAFHIIADTQKD